MCTYLQTDFKYSKYYRVYITGNGSIARSSLNVLYER